MILKREYHIKNPNMVRLYNPTSSTSFKSEAMPRVKFKLNLGSCVKSMGSDLNDVQSLELSINDVGNWERGRGQKLVKIANG